VTTGVVVTVNVAEVAPADTVTFAGTCAALGLVLDNTTCAPPAGAGPSSRTVPVEGVPPITDVGLTATEVKAAAVTVRLAVRLVPRVPVIVAVVVELTGLVVTVKVAVVAFAATVTLAGV
jgi:hypothetical protein